MCARVHSGRVWSRVPAIRRASGNPSQSRTSSRAASGSRSTRSVPMKPLSICTPSSSGRGSREIRRVASRPASLRRLLTMTVLPGPDGSRGRTCRASSASSSTSRRRRPLVAVRQAATSSSSSSPIRSPTVPRVRSMRARALRGESGCPVAWARRSRKRQPSGCRGTRCRAVWTISRVLPMPGVPSTARTVTFPAGPGSASSASSSCLPTNGPTSPGSSFTCGREGSGTGATVTAGGRRTVSSCRSTASYRLRNSSPGSAPCASRRRPRSAWKASSASAWRPLLYNALTWMASSPSSNGQDAVNSASSSTASDERPSRKRQSSRPFRRVRRCSSRCRRTDPA